ncbi:nuclear transport factor 2 family protein [Granulicella arctica]|uniref:nuclear transport factor 2 family protein n=1 Tax=Granulicella arctica TaxID=940613 RepID=UPI0021DFA435|nr:nuclear transport factor 2 family protein [Granulicella arctica]
MFSAISPRASTKLTIYNLPMKLPLALLAPLLAASTLSAQSSSANPADQAVLTTIQTLFSAMAAHDPAATRAAFLPGASLLTIKDNKSTLLSVDDFVTRIAKSVGTPIEERIHEPLVRIDRDVAVVWAPYAFLANGKVDHCGTDLFNLILIDGSWHITNITWNSITACSAK